MLWGVKVRISKEKAALHEILYGAASAFIFRYSSIYAAFASYFDSTCFLTQRKQARCAPKVSAQETGYET